MNKNKINKRKREYYKKNRKKILLQRHQNYIKSPQLRNNVFIRNKKFRDEHPDYYKKWFLINRQKKTLQDKIWAANHKDSRKASYKRWRNSKKGKQNIKNYYIKNKERLLRYSKDYYNTKKNRLRKNLLKKEKLRNHLSFNLKERLRSRVYKAFKDYTRTGKIRKSDEYGIDYESIINRLKLILPSNYNPVKYHIEHEPPLCSYDFTKEAEIRKAFAPENTFWLSKHQNLSKASKDKEKKFKNNI